MLGIGLEYSRRSRSVGGRAAQHVEADPAGGSMVPRRQSASVAALFAIPRAATQSANGGASDAGLRLADRSSRELTCFAGAVAALVLSAWSDTRKPKRSTKTALSERATIHARPGADLQTRSPSPTASTAAPVTPSAFPETP